MVSINFVSGKEKGFKYPNYINESGLKSRFAVIQSTYKEGCPDMYFDEELWQTLIAFISNFNPEAKIFIANEVGDLNKNESPLDEFSNRIRNSQDEYLDPPAVAILRSGIGPVICMFTEYWTQIGGKYPYADSYTYSLFSDVEISNDVVKFISDSPSSHQWTIGASVLMAGG